MKLWEGRLLIRTLCFFSGSSPTEQSAQSLSDLGCFLNEQATSCKPSSEVRNTFSHFSCSCQIFKKSPSFSQQVVKMRYKTLPPRVVWKKRPFFKKAEGEALPDSLLNYRISEQRMKTIVRTCK